MINQIYKLNMIPDKVPVMVRVSQYDQYSRTIIFDLYDGAIEYEIPSGSTITIRGTKPDKTGFEYPCTFSGNRVEFILEPQVSVISGLVPAELRITSNNEIVGSCNFVFNVEETPLDKDTIISDTELPLIEEASQAAVIAQGAAARAEEEADRAEQVLSTAVKSVNNELPDAQGNVEIKIPDVSNKMDLVVSATADDILLVNALGQAIDSGKSMLDVLKNVKVLGSSDSLNDITENGFYYVGTGTVGISDAWIGSVLLVFGDDNKKIQYFFKPDGATDPDGVNLYTIMRSYQNGAWSSWQVPVFQNNVIKTAGVHSNLNLTNPNANVAYFGRTDRNTANKPDTAAGGFVITAMSNVNAYGRQLYISDQGVFTRSLKGSVWNAWETIGGANKGALVLSHAVSSDVTTTSSITLATGTFTKLNDNSDMLITIWGRIKTSRYTSSLRVWIDGVERSRATTNLQTEYSTASKQDIVKGISKGDHTIEFKMVSQDSGTTATAPAYQEKYCSIIEL